MLGTMRPNTQLSQFGDCGGGGISAAASEACFVRVLCLCEQCPVDCTSISLSRPDRTLERFPSALLSSCAAARAFKLITQSSGVFCTHDPQSLSALHFAVCSAWSRPEMNTNPSFQINAGQVVAPIKESGSLMCPIEPYHFR